MYGLVRYVRGPASRNHGTTGTPEGAPCGAVRRRRRAAVRQQATTPAPEWNGQPVRMALEEDAWLDTDGTRRWVLTRQERFHLVR